MEINPVPEVYKANQNNTVMLFQIYKNISNSNKTAKTLQKKRYKQSKTAVPPMTAKVPLHF